MDTSLSPKDMRNLKNLFPKFMAFEGKENMLYVELSNVGNRSYIVKLDIYEINPDGVKTLLDTENYGNIRPDKEKTRMEVWVPAIAGRNYIYGEIYVMEVDAGNCHSAVNWTLINTFKKSFNVVPGDRPVRIINGDWVVNTPTIIESETVVVNGDVIISENFTLLNSTLLAGNFTVTEQRTVLSGSVVDLQATYNGQYKAEVYPPGNLIVYGKILNNPDDIYYNFYMNGSLTVDKNLTIPGAEPGSISEVNGNPDDLSEPGGIICVNPNGTVIIRNENMNEGKLYLSPISIWWRT